MPGVRFGPDITDDAAQILNDILEFKALKKAKKSDRDVTRRYKRSAKMAKQLFGLTDKDIEKGRYKDLRVMAQYGNDARRPGAPGRVYRRAKLYRNKRTGKIAKRSMMEEGRRQTLFDKKQKGRAAFTMTKAEREAEINSKVSMKNKRGKALKDKRGNIRYRKPTEAEKAERRSLREGARVAGELTYLGRTNPKGLRDAQARFDRRMARLNKKGGVLSDRGTRRIKIRPNLKGGKADVAKLNIARQRGFLTGSKGVRGRIVPLPKAPKSATRAKTANKQRKKAVRNAGKTRKTNVRRGKKK